jgi:peroxiredoxin
MCHRRGTPPFPIGRLVLAVLLLFCEHEMSTRALAADPKPGRTEPPTAESIVKRAAAFLKNAKSLSVRIEVQPNLNNPRLRSTRTIAIERPNRIAIGDLPAAPFSSAIVCDGKTLLVTQFRKYIEDSAPASLDELLDDIATIEIRVDPILSALCADEPGDALMRDVKKTKYVGTETIDEQRTHHLLLTGDVGDWDLWVNADGDPLVRRIRVDLSKFVDGDPGPFAIQPRSGYVQDFRDWRIDRGHDASTFVVRAPEGATRVETFIEPPKSQDRSPSPLLGKPAPEIDVKQLDGGQFELADERREHIVVLGFWSTSSFSRGQELPLLAELAQFYASQGVVFRVVADADESKTIRKTLARKKLNLPVLLDPVRGIAGPYQVLETPTFVIVDKQGTVQSVHVGVNAKTTGKLLEDIDAVVAGKDVAGETLRRASETKRIQAVGMKEVWSLEGSYHDTATGPKPEQCFAIRDDSPKALVERLNLGGKVVETLQLPEEQAFIVRTARLAPGVTGFLTSESWSSSVVATNSDGTKRWEIAGRNGVNDISAADLTGDGVDETIIGHNIGGGLAVYSSEGRPLWSHPALGTVGHVAAGDTDGDGTPEVVATSEADGCLHLFSGPTGAPIRTINVGVELSVVRVAPARSSPGSKGAALLALGIGGKYWVMFVLEGDGTIRRKIEFAKQSAGCHSLAVAPGGNLAAVGFRDGVVCVVDLDQGTVIARAEKQGAAPNVGWLPRGAQVNPILLVATGDALNAFRLKPNASRRGAGEP